MKRKEYYHFEDEANERVSELQSEGKQEVACKYRIAAADDGNPYRLWTITYEEDCGAR